MGYDISKNQFVIIRHNDRPHDHVHIVVSRVGLDGSVVSDSNDRKKCHKATAKAALAVDLKPVPPPDKTKPMARVSRDEAEHAQRMGVIHPKLTVAARLDVALEHSRDFEQFKQNAAKLGIEVREASNTSGVYGVSYALTSPPAGFRVTSWKGSTIGPGYSFKHIERRLAGEGLDQIAQARQFKTTLDFTKAETGKNGKTVRRWENGAIAAIYTDTAISFRSESAASIRLAAQLAEKMGWKEVHVGGSTERQKIATAEYQKLGIKVINAPEMEVTADAKSNQNPTTASQGRSSSADEARPPAPKATANGSAKAENQKTTIEERSNRMAQIDPLQFQSAPEIATANAVAQDAAEADSKAISRAAMEREAADRDQEHKRLADAFLVDREFWNSMFQSGGVDQIEQRAQAEAERRAATLLADTSAAAGAKRALLLKELEKEEKEKKLRAEKAAKAQEKREKERAADPLRPTSKPKG
jgi:hypothetical protein